MDAIADQCVKIYQSDSFAITGDIEGCLFDGLQCHQWWQSNISGSGDKLSCCNRIPHSQDFLSLYEKEPDYQISQSFAVMGKAFKAIHSLWNLTGFLAAVMLSNL